MVLRETMRLRQHRSDSDGVEMCRAIEAEKGSITVKQALLYAAGVHVRDEGRARRGSLDAGIGPRRCPGQGQVRKGRGKDGKAKHKPPGRPRAGSGARQDVLILEVVEPVDDADLLAASEGAGPKGPHIGKDAGGLSARCATCSTPSSPSSLGSVGTTACSSGAFAATRRRGSPPPGSAPRPGRSPAPARARRATRRPPGRRSPPRTTSLRRSGTRAPRRTWCRSPTTGTRGASRCTRSTKLRDASERPSAPA